MRVIKRDFLGRERTLCFSSRVYCNVMERYGSLQGMFETMASDNTAESIAANYWLFAQLSDAGARYTRRADGNDEKPLTEEDLLDLCGPEEAAMIGKMIVDAISVGTARDQEAMPPKNAEATAPGQ